jgi:hypothetical protein
MPPGKAIPTVSPGNTSAKQTRIAQMKPSVNVKISAHAREISHTPGETTRKKG